ncbi:MAG: hypothetical protein K0S55_1309, partial [Clostridia bacterium]|nr:hypothetical protein [Clostridia bacterium]
MNDKLKIPDKIVKIQKPGKKIIKKKKTKISLKKVTVLFIILIILILLPFVSCSEDFKTARSRAMAKSEIVYKSNVFTPSEKDSAGKPYPILDEKTGLYYFIYNKTSGSRAVKLTDAIYENGFYSTGFFTGENKLKT